MLLEGLLLLPVLSLARFLPTVSLRELLLLYPVINFTFSWRCAGLTDNY